jgi:propanol-preferring alcohol dehydrogenase
MPSPEIPAHDEPLPALILEPLPRTMRAMVLEAPGHPLVLKTLQLPTPSTQEVLIKVIACGICRTDLHVTTGELPRPRLPLIPGHEIVGRIVRIGSEVTTLQPGDLVGVPWLAYTCGHCRYCQRGQENLCENALFTGYTHDGGYAEYTLAFEEYCVPMPHEYANPSGAPLLCAGLIGYRSYTLAGDNVKHLGLYGFGAAAHILIQVARYQGQRVYAFTRDDDEAGRDFALSLGATWAGGSSLPPPHLLDASIIFAPVGSLVPLALRASDKGATVVCGGIHMSDIPSFPYAILWEERSVRSVANLTRRDAREFLDLAPRIPIHTTTQPFPLHQANEALDALRSGRIHGAAVLIP